MNPAVPPLHRIRPDVRAAQAYAVADASGLIKLDSMENPYRLPQSLQRELGERLGRVALNRYPGPDVQRLRAELRIWLRLPDGFDVLLGNGSDEVISMLTAAVDQPGACILAPLPGFVMYGITAALQGVKFVGVDLTDDFQLDEAAMAAAIRQHRPALLYLAYPNNPTATLWNAEVIERLVQAQGEQGGLVVMDEAYQPFASRTYADRMAQHAHVLVMRTFSKFGLAGVRLGYLIGPRALIAELDKVHAPYNVSVLNVECGRFAIEHAAEYERQAAAICAERTRLMAQLQSLADANAAVTVWPSEANMILLRVPDAARTFAGMKSRGVLIKNVSAMHPLLVNCLRLTVGDAEENAALFAALKASL